MKTRAECVILALCLMTGTPLAMAQAEPNGREPVKVPVSQLHTLLVAAIDARDGEAHGILDGELADAITRRFGSSTPIHVDIRTVQRYAQPGCRRLALRLWQDGVQLPDAAKPGRQTLDIGIDYCRDGLPPASRS